MEGVYPSPIQLLLTGRTPSLAAKLGLVIHFGFLMALALVALLNAKNAKEITPIRVFRDEIDESQFQPLLPLPSISSQPCHHGSYRRITYLSTVLHLMLSTLYKDHISVRARGRYDGFEWSKWIEEKQQHWVHTYLGTT